MAFFVGALMTGCQGWGFAVVAAMFAVDAFNWWKEGQR
jgi:hypothetical protein